MKKQVIEDVYLKRYYKVADKFGNFVVVCLDPFTGWHVVREMTPEYFKEFHLNHIELNSNGNNYFKIDDEGFVCNVDRCSAWYAANSWTAPRKDLNKLRKSDDQKGAFGWYAVTPIMNNEEFAAYFEKKYGVAFELQYSSKPDGEFYIDNCGFLRNKYDEKISEL